MASIISKYSFEELCNQLSAANTKSRREDIIQYVQAYQKYHKAQENIDEYGVIVVHPRTGIPIENPYLKIQIQAQSIMRKFQRLKTDCLWA